MNAIDWLYELIGAYKADNAFCASEYHKLNENIQCQIIRALKRVDGGQEIIDFLNGAEG